MPGDYHDSNNKKQQRQTRAMAASEYGASASAPQDCWFVRREIPTPEKNMPEQLDFDYLARKKYPEWPVLFAAHTTPVADLYDNSGRGVKKRFVVRPAPGAKLNIISIEELFDEVNKMEDQPIGTDTQFFASDETCASVLNLMIYRKDGHDLYTRNSHKSLLDYQGFGALLSKMPAVHGIDLPTDSCHKGGGGAWHGEMIFSKSAAKLLTVTFVKDWAHDVAPSKEVQRLNRGAPADIALADAVIDTNDARKRVNKLFTEEDGDAVFKRLRARETFEKPAEPWTRASVEQEMTQQNKTLDKFIADNVQHPCPRSVNANPLAVPMDRDSVPAANTDPAKAQFGQKVHHRGDAGVVLEIRASDGHVHVAFSTGQQKWLPPCELTIQAVPIAEATALLEQSIQNINQCWGGWDQSQRLDGLQGIRTALIKAVECLETDADLQKLARHKKLRDNNEVKLFGVTNHKMSTLKFSVSESE